MRFFKSVLLSLGFSSASLIGRFFMLSGKMILWMVAALTFVFTSSIVASPFNDILAERTERFAEIPLPSVTKKNFKRACSFNRN